MPKTPSEEYSNQCSAGHGITNAPENDFRYRYSSRYDMPKTPSDEYSNQYSAGHVMTDAQGTTSVTECRVWHA
jgi:hypothetical protein